jgi:predicted XRE-type DNA-binding protein
MMPPAPDLTMRNRVKELAVTGLSHKQIAEALGCPRTTVSHYMLKLLRDGEIPPVVVRKTIVSTPQDTRLTVLKRKYGIKLGTMINLMKSLETEHMHWLFEQTPTGSEVADIIRAIIIDAYEEENDA